MTILRAIPTFHIYPNQLQASTRTSTSSNHAVLRRSAACHHPASGSLTSCSGSSKRCLILRSNNLTTATASTTVELESASNVVRKFYDGINRGDLVLVEELIALDCVYEDLIYPQPFVGRNAILDFFKRFRGYITDLQFAIDEISEEDTSAVGVIWHVEWKGKPFPFSKGCSFYRVNVINDRRQIVYGRDSVEPFIKPGETALVALRGITWLLETFPFLADRL